ncbi:MAG: hypothetical protein ACR2NP_09015 [Pirellulaceae bacterium]
MAGLVVFILSFFGGGESADSIRELNNILIISEDSDATRVPVLIFSEDQWSSDDSSTSTTPFYPYPQVPLGWRKATLEWDDGWWYLDFGGR